MTPELINSLAIQLLPVSIALAVAVYKIAVQYLPANKQAHLRSLLGNLDTIASTVVSAVEQSLAGAPGADKKAEAANVIESFLGVVGIKVDPALVSAAIEAAVYEMNLYKPATALAGPAPVDAEAEPAATPVAEPAVQAVTSNPVAQA